MLLCFNTAVITTRLCREVCDDYHTAHHVGDLESLQGAGLATCGVGNCEVAAGAGLSMEI